LKKEDNSAEEKGEFRKEICSGKTMILIDPNLLNLAIVNLIKNTNMIIIEIIECL
jgi:hypothetical protein